jgi:hypothetical protein
MCRKTTADPKIRLRAQRYFEEIITQAQQLKSHLAQFFNNNLCQ